MTLFEQEYEWTELLIHTCGLEVLVKVVLGHELILSGDLDHLEADLLDKKYLRRESKSDQVGSESLAEMRGG